MSEEIMNYEESLYTGLLREDDNFEGEADNFEEYADNMDRIETNAAQERRISGARRLGKMGRFAKELNKKAEKTGTPAAELMSNVLEANPEATERIKAYVFDRGYYPSENYTGLMCQAAHCRNEHIAEVQDQYDPNNYDEVANCYTSRKSARRDRREAKFKRRTERRAARAAAQIDRIKSKGQAPQTTEEKTEEEGGEILPATKSMTSKTAALLAPATSDVVALESPDETAAHAEIIGEEIEGTEYVGADEADNFLPFLAGAIQVGGDLIKGLKGKGADFTNFKTLFKKRPSQATKDAAKKLPANKLPEILNKGIKEIVEGVEARKKQDFLKDNIIYIVIAVAVIFFIGKSAK
jgi:hypothetical protein